MAPSLLSWCVRCIHRFSSLPQEARPRPRARRGHAALVHEGHLYVCGGWTDMPMLFLAHNDVWRCRLADGEWQRLADVPFVALTMPWASLHNEWAFVGAKDENAQPQHLLVLHAPTGRLRRIVRCPAVWQPPLFAATAALHEHVYIFGGLAAHDVNTQQLWALDLRSGRVTSLRSNEALAARNSSTLTPIGSQLLLFGGGCHPSVYFNDLWLLRPGYRPQRAPPQPLGQLFLPFIESVYNEPAFSDVTFTQGSQRVALSKLVLASRSPFFSAMFRSGMREAARDVAVPVLDSVSFDTFVLMTRFIYSNRVQFTPENALSLALCASVYDVPDLSLFCEEYIITELLHQELYAELLLFTAEHHLHALFDRIVLTASLSWPELWQLPPSFPELLAQRVQSIMLQALSLPGPISALSLSSSLSDSTGLDAT